MPVTRYRVHNGRIRGESTGGVATTYLTDALGSVTATANQSASVVNTYRAKPYGGRLAKTGAGADPRYEYTGDMGSRRTERAYAEQHNRARHLGTRQGAWTSVDPLWPGESAYGYVSGNPTTWTDPSGTSISGINECECHECNGIYVKPCTSPSKPISKAVASVCSMLRSCDADPDCRRGVKKCIRASNYPKANGMWACLSTICLPSGMRTEVTCQSGRFTDCGNGGENAYTTPGCLAPSPACSCNIDICAEKSSTICGSCGRSVVRAWKETPYTSDINQTLLHEMSHCCGLGADAGPFAGDNAGVGDQIANCVIAWATKPRRRNGK